MSGCSFKVLTTAGLLLTALLAPLSPLLAQEPSSGLKQADSDYRAGATALSRNDLDAALDNFQNVVRHAASLSPGTATVVTIPLPCWAAD